MGRQRREWGEGGGDRGRGERGGEEGGGGSEKNQRNRCRVKPYCSTRDRLREVALCGTRDVKTKAIAHPPEDPDRRFMPFLLPLYHLQIYIYILHSHFTLRSKLKSHLFSSDTVLSFVQTALSLSVSTATPLSQLLSHSVFHKDQSLDLYSLFFIQFLFPLCMKSTDSQLQKSAAPHQIPDLLPSTQMCIDDVKTRMTVNKLKLNDDTIEAMVTVGPYKIEVSSFLFPDSTASVPTSGSVKNLGLTLDCHLTMKTHISNLVRSANVKLRRVSSIRHLLSTDATKILVSAFVLSRVDYCNYLLSGCLQYFLNKVQKVQNNAVRLVMS